MNTTYGHFSVDVKGKVRLAKSYVNSAAEFAHDIVELFNHFSQMVLEEHDPEKVFDENPEKIPDPVKSSLGA